MKISLDVDDVLLDFVGGIIKFHNDKYGTNLARANFKSYGFNDVWGGTMDEAVTKVDEFIKGPYFWNLKPVNGSVRVVNALAKRRENLYVITSRSTKREKITREQLMEHFGNKFISINFAKNHYTGWGGKTKAEICAEFGIDYHIEDSLEYAQQIVKETPKTKVLLFDAPWNQTGEKLNCRIKRVTSWEQIFASLRN